MKLLPVRTQLFKLSAFLIFCCFCSDLSANVIGYAGNRRGGCNQGDRCMDMIAQRSLKPDQGYELGYNGYANYPKIYNSGDICNNIVQHEVTIEFQEDISGFVSLDFYNLKDYLNRHKYIIYRGSYQPNSRSITWKFDIMHFYTYEFGGFHGNLRFSLEVDFTYDGDRHKAVFDYDMNNTGTEPTNGGSNPYRDGNSIQIGSENALSDVTVTVPNHSGFMLLQAHLPVKGRFDAHIIDMNGRNVKMVSNNILQGAGNYSRKVDIRNLSSGMYFLKIVYENEEVIKKFIVRS